MSIITNFVDDCCEAFNPPGGASQSFVFVVRKIGSDQNITIKRKTFWLTSQMAHSRKSFFIATCARHLGILPNTFSNRFTIRLFDNPHLSIEIPVEDWNTTFLTIREHLGTKFEVVRIPIHLA